MSNVSSIVVVVPSPSVKVSTVGGPQGQQGVPGQSAIQRVAASAMSAGQVVRTHAAGQQMQAATTDLRTRPFDAILLGDIGSGATGNFHVAGPVPANVLQLGAGVACAVGVNASGVPVRSTDPTCVSAPNWLGTCDAQGNVTIAQKNIGHYNPVDFGAAPDDPAFADTNYAAFVAMFAAMGSTNKGDEVRVGPGTWYINGDISPGRPVTVRGVNCQQTVIQFSMAGQAIRFQSASQAGPGTAALSQLLDCQVFSPVQHFSEWQPNHAYIVGDQIRVKLGSLVVFGAEYQEDLGFHFRCTQAGTSGAMQPSWQDPGQNTDDGTAKWTTLAWSVVVMSSPNCVALRNFVRGGTDGGIHVYGHSASVPATLADGSTIQGNLISGEDSDGNGIKFDGGDANTACTIGNTIVGFARGAAIFDNAFLSNAHYGNNCTTTRRSYVGASAAGETLWAGNYAELDAGEYRIVSPQMVIQMHGGQRAPESTCVTFHNGEWSGVPYGFTSASGRSTFGLSLGGVYAEFLQRVGDTSQTTDAFIDSDSDDPGGYFSARWASLYFQTSREITGERSIWGPNWWRFPQGVYLGHPRAGLKSPIWVTSNDAPPTSTDIAYVGRLVWHTGDIVHNQNAGGVGVTPGWRAARNGGWGGGRNWTGTAGSGRRWQASTGQIAVGESLEPSAGSPAKVFRIKRFEVFTSGSWVWDDRLYASTSTTEPTWPSNNGDTVTELLDPTHRILWECWGDIGMTWDVMPPPATQVTT